MIPPFDVPYPYVPALEKSLQASPLLQFYRLNEQDFVEVTGLLFAEIGKSPHAAMLYGPDGFRDFCSFLRMLLMGPPTQTLRPSLGKDGRAVNVFGEAIQKHLPGVPSFQDLYSFEGSRLFASQDQDLLRFVAYVAIKALQQGISEWTEERAEAAKRHHAELFTGRRKLKSAHDQIFH